MKAQKIVAVVVVVMFAIIGVFGEALASSKKNRPTTEVEAFKNSSISSSSRSSSRSSISRSGNSNVTVQNIISGSSRSGRSYGGGRSYRSHRGRGNSGDEMLYGIGGAIVGGVLGYVIGNQNNRQQPVIVQPAAYPQQSPPQANASAEITINGLRCQQAGYDQTGAAILRCSR